MAVIRCTLVCFVIAGLFANIARAAKLQIAVVGSELHLSWLAAANNYTLEFAGELDSGLWTAVTNEPIIFGDVKYVILPVGTNSSFFRLNAPFAAPPLLTNVSAPVTVVRGAPLTLNFDYLDPDGDIDTVLLTVSHALATLNGEFLPSTMHITGEAGHGTVDLNTSELPYGPVEFSLQLKDSLWYFSDTTNFTVTIAGLGTNGTAPSIVAFSRLAASYTQPIGSYSRVPVRCTLQVADPDSDLDFIRLRITPPFGSPQISDLPAADLGLDDNGGTVTVALTQFSVNSSLGNYTLEVTPYDRNGHSGTPASVSVALVNTGGEVPRLAIGPLPEPEGTPGSNAVITGSGFVTNPAARTVFELGEIPCEIISLTTNVATVRIPVGARTGAFIARNPDGAQTISGYPNFVVPEHIAITPGADEPPAVSIGATATFQAVIGSSRTNKTLLWHVNGLAGGNATVG
ncbi:MAG: hypothetical protein U1F65_11115, partial [Verrucomicrobiota bacterium]